MIAIASEHAGFALKEFLKKELVSHGFEVADMGVSSDEPVDYPFIAENLCRAVASKSAEFGILICGTGIGMSIAANKVNGIRAALCTDTFSARLTREHNNANILCLGAWLTAEKLSWQIVNIFLTTAFEGGRHIPRLEKIKILEDRQR